MVAELQSGPCIVIEVTHKDESLNIVADFRNLCGPIDPVCITASIAFSPVIDILI